MSNETKPITLDSLVEALQTIGMRCHISVEPQHDPIVVWPFDQASPELQALSTNGGDEDWVALIPPYLKNEWIGWLEQGPFGCCCVDEYPHPSLPGWTVKIGCHA